MTILQNKGRRVAYLLSTLTRIACEILFFHFIYVGSYIRSTHMILVECLHFVD